MIFEIENFRGLNKKVTVNLNKDITVLEEGNGYGKSSVLEGIKFAITGKVPEGAINKLHDKATVIWELEDEQGTIIKRVLTRADNGCRQTAYVNGKETTLSSLSKFYECKFGPEFELVAALVTDPDTIISMDSKTLTNLLLQIIPSDISNEDILKALENNNVSFETMMELEMKLPENCTLENISEIYDEYVSERKLLKKEIADFTSLIKSRPDTPEISEEEIDTRLAEIKELEGSVLLREKQKKEYNTAIEKNASIANQITELDKLLKNPVIEYNDAEIVEREELLNEVTKTLREKEQTISVLRNNAESTKKMLNNLEGDSCPLSSKLKCTTDKTPLKEELKANLDETVAEGKNLASQIDNLNNKVECIRKEIESMRKQKNEYLIYKANLEKKQVLQLSYVKVPERPPEAENDINFAETKAKLIIQKKAWETISSLEEKKKILKKKKSRLDNSLKEIIELLAPNGVIRNIAMSIALGPINRCLESVSKQYGDCSARLITTDGEGVTILCKTGIDKPILPFSALSTGEKVIFGTFIAFMLSKITCFSDILLLDTFERVDKLHQDKVLDVMKENYKYILAAKCS